MVKPVMTTFRNTHALARLLNQISLPLGLSEELWISATSCLLPGLLTSELSAVRINCSVAKVVAGLLADRHRFVGRAPPSGECAHASIKSFLPLFYPHVIIITSPPAHFHVFFFFCFLIVNL